MNRRQAITKACLLLKRQAKEESLARFLLMYMLDEMREFNENLALELTEEDEQKYFQLINKSILVQQFDNYLIINDIEK